MELWQLTRSTIRKIENSVRMTTITWATMFFFLVETISMRVQRQLNMWPNMANPFHTSMAYYLSCGLSSTFLHRIIQGVIWRNLVALLLPMREESHRILLINNLVYPQRLLFNMSGCVVWVSWSRYELIIAELLCHIMILWHSFYVFQSNRYVTCASCTSFNMCRVYRLYRAKGRNPILESRDIRSHFSINQMIFIFIY